MKYLPSTFTYRNGPLPEHSGKLPDPGLVALCAAANIAHVALYSHFHSQSPAWKVALIVLAAAVFPYVFLRTISLHRRNEIARTLWNDIEDTVFEAISGAIRMYREGDENDFPPLLSDIRTIWLLHDGEIQAEIDQFSASARHLIRRDIARIPFVEALWEELSQGTDCWNSDCADRVYLSLHRRCTQRLRPDMILVLIALAGANAFLMGMMW